MAALVIALLPGARSAQAQQAQAVLLGTFDNPDYVAVASGQPRLLFVVEQSGQIQVMRDEVQLGHAFLDIRGIVNFGGEQGVLSMAFAPDYATSGRFYVAFNNKNGDVEIAEFQRSAGDATRADPGTRRVLLLIPHRGASNHNGGQLQFGPDGFLYISVGDGGNLSPPGVPARDRHRLLGKILRIDPLPSGGKPYGIPADNPYVGTGFRPEIYAYGFRNPWRFSFDGTRIAIADVGQSTEEEVDFLKVTDAKGVNFGWPQYEGNVVFDNAHPGADPAKFPMFVYPHTGGRCAIIGGFVMSDPNLPALAGRYLYGDLCDGVIHSFSPNVAKQRARGDAPVGITAPNLSGFGKGFNGVMYFTQTSGEVSRIAPP
jgi:glucose/arabinose dehydrogenase